MQAALASDFSITEFKHLKDLLLWHGRNSYKRTGLLSSFIFHRGLTISVIYFWATLIFGYMMEPLFNYLLQMGYASVFTMLPVFSLVRFFKIFIYLFKGIEY